MVNSLSKKFIKHFLPPILVKAYQASKKSNQYGFFGNYQSWDAAKNETEGYDSDLILERVKESLLKVKNGEATYERDSVLFEQIQYSFPVLAALLKVAVENQGSLSVLDFGGSLGSSYFQCKDFLLGLNHLEWNIVEQAKFVDCGRHFFESKDLQFFDSIDLCIKVKNVDIILLSGVVQYLESPHLFLNHLLNYNFKYILFDRTSFISDKKDRLTIQRVPPEIYPASYPAWFFNIDNFLKIFIEKYDLIFDFNSSDQVNISSQFKGLFLKLKNPTLTLD